MLDIHLKDVITTIVTAVDLMNPILKNHHRHVAIIAYHLGKECGLSEKALAELVIAATLHDIGAITVEEGKKLIELDVKEPRTHEILGATMLSGYKAFEAISMIIRHHHIRYSDCEQYILVDEPIKIESFILHLADRIDILTNHEDVILSQTRTIIDTIQELSGDLFDPSLVDKFEEVGKRDAFWLDIEELTMEEILNKVKIDLVCASNDMMSLEELVATLSRIIDYKSAFTATHSTGVASVAYELAKLDGLSEEKCQEIKIAAYLHDIGKIAVPTELIAKTDGLNEDEYNQMKTHAYYTRKILGKIKGFEQIAHWAASHHEKLDGSGYPSSLKSNELTTEIEIISYADIFTALCETRPYREALEVNDAIELIRNYYKPIIGNDIFSLLENNSAYLDALRYRVQSAAHNAYEQIALAMHSNWP